MICYSNESYNNDNKDIKKYTCGKRKKCENFIRIRRLYDKHEK